MASPTGQKGAYMPKQKKHRANLLTTRLVYLRQEDVFRFVAANPSICTQYITFKMKGTDEQGTQSELPGTTKPKFLDPLAQLIKTHNLNTVGTVQYFNCAGYEQGERQRL
jgi:hypothetical protein